MCIVCTLGNVFEVIKTLMSTNLKEGLSCILARDYEALRNGGELRQSGGCQKFGLTSQGRTEKSRGIRNETSENVLKSPIML